MKTIKQFETAERLVKLIQTENGYTVLVFAENGKTADKTYTREFWAKRKYTEYKNAPLSAVMGGI